MKYEHTPGPWIADDNEGFGVWRIWSRMTPSGSGKPGPVVADVIGDSAETDANAYLIAAAPDLLEALQSIKAEFERLKEAAPAVRDAAYLDGVLAVITSRSAAAIAKATGGAV